MSGSFIVELGLDTKAFTRGLRACKRDMAALGRLIERIKRELKAQEKRARKRARILRRQKKTRRRAGA